MRIPDEAIPVFSSLLLDSPLDPELPPRDAKRALAHRLTAWLHGEAAADAAQARFDTVHVRRELPEQIDEFAFAANGGEPVHLPALLAEAFGISRSEGRRMLAQAAVKLDGEPLDDSDLDLAAERLDGSVIQVGRRRFKRLRRL
jgi:tyrosyl-tRNA synthetase